MEGREGNGLGLARPCGCGESLKHVSGGLFSLSTPIQARLGGGETGRRSVMSGAAEVEI